MPDLIDRLFFLVLERTVRVEGVFLEEETNLIAGGEEVLVSEAALFVCGKDRDYFRRIEGLDQLLGARAQPIAIGLVDETFENEITIVVVLVELLV